MGNQKSKKYRRQTPPRPGSVEYEINFVQIKLDYIKQRYERDRRKYKKSYDTAEGLSILIKENYRYKRMVCVKNLLEQLQTLYDSVKNAYETDLERQKYTQGSSKETNEQDNNDYRYPVPVLTPAPQAACAEESPAQRPQTPPRNSADVHDGVPIVNSPSDFRKKNLSSALGQPSVW